MARLLVDDFAILKQSIIDGLGIAVLPEYESDLYFWNYVIQGVWSPLAFRRPVELVGKQFNEI